MNILEELYYGNVNPNEKQFIRPSGYAKVANTLVQSEEKLTEFLRSSPEYSKQLDWLEELVKAQMTMNSFSETERFIEGFRVGAQIMLDTFILPQKSVIRDITEVV